MFFYVDNGQIAGSNTIWLQKTLKAMVRMFKRVGLQTNLGKTKTMVCTPGFIWGQQGTAAYKRIATREEETFQERKKTRVSF